MEHVGKCLFEGIENGQHYIHTHDDVSRAFAKDRFESIMEHKRVVNGHSAKVMEGLVAEAMAKAAAAEIEGRMMKAGAKL